MIPPGITRNASHFGTGATRATPLVFLSKIGPPRLDFHPLQAGVSKTTTGTQVRYLTSTPMANVLRMWRLGFFIRENSRKICRLGFTPALLRRLGPCVTKEELESVYQKIESVTRIFEKMPLFCVFFKKN